MIVFYTGEYSKISSPAAGARTVKNFTTVFGIIYRSDSRLYCENTVQKSGWQIEAILSHGFIQTVLVNLLVKTVNPYQNVLIKVILTAISTTRSHHTIACDGDLKWCQVGTD